MSVFHKAKKGGKEALIKTLKQLKTHFGGP
jgi:hypothetical protein